MSRFRRIASCRICGNTELVPVIDLGDQALTGVFPESRDDRITRGPLELVRCTGGEKTCGLVQLFHSYDSDEMYGESYGYRSSLNQSMVLHLKGTVDKLMAIAMPEPQDVVIDIGSNDGTTLSFFPESLIRVGVDPLASRFADSYHAGVVRVPDFFSAGTIDRVLGGRKAKIITSMAMFYDVENPREFVREIASTLEPDGIWYFEQSYLPAMLAMNAYDTICHEHLEYYALRQIEWLLNDAGLRLLDVEVNTVNGGSFAVTAGRDRTRTPAGTDRVDAVVRSEAAAALDSLSTYGKFRDRVTAHRTELRTLLEQIRTGGERVIGYGASTKGNVLLQYCELSARDLPVIADVNSDKFGRMTPGTFIPIVSAEEGHAMKPDYLLVLPWHFRSNLLSREREFLERGGRMIFPLPLIEVVGREGS
jgi:hypothetical protein